MSLRCAARPSSRSCHARTRRDHGLCVGRWRQGMLLRTLWGGLCVFGMYPSRLPVAAFWALLILVTAGFGIAGTDPTMLKDFPSASIVTSAASLLPYLGSSGTLVIARRLFRSRTAAATVARMHQVRISTSFAVVGWSVVAAIVLVLGGEIVISMLPVGSGTHSRINIDVGMDGAKLFTLINMIVFAASSAITLIMALTLTLVGETHVLSMHATLARAAAVSGGAVVKPSRWESHVATTSPDVEGPPSLGEPLLGQGTPAEHPWTRASVHEGTGHMSSSEASCCGVQAAAQVSIDDAIVELQRIRGDVRRDAKRLDPWLTWHGVTYGGSILMVLVAATLSPYYLSGGVVAWVLSVEALLLMIAVAPLFTCARLFKAWRRLARQFNQLPPPPGVAAALSTPGSTGEAARQPWTQARALLLAHRQSVDRVKSYIQDSPLGFSVAGVRITPRLGWATVGVSLLFRLKPYLVS